MNDLNEDFEKIAEAINAKLKEAAEAVREASRLAKEAGVLAIVCTLLNEEDFFLDDRNFKSKEEYDNAFSVREEKMDMIDTNILESALTEAGWSMSSSYC